MMTDEASLRRRKQTKKEKRVAAELATAKVLCPIDGCDKELRDVRGQCSVTVRVED